MTKLIARFRKSESGATAIEYGLIAALIAVVIIGATNRPFDIDDAILRRFSIHIHLDLPNPAARKHVFGKMLSKVKTNLNNEDLDEIVRRTELFSNADLAALCREASFEPVREIPTEELASKKSADIRGVTMRDFEAAFKKVAKSVTDQTLAELKSWSESRK